MYHGTARGYCIEATNEIAAMRDARKYFAGYVNPNDSYDDAMRLIALVAVTKTFTRSTRIARLV
jgi:hypothetical protein